MRWPLHAQDILEPNYATRLGSKYAGADLKSDSVGYSRTLSAASVGKPGMMLNQSSTQRHLLRRKQNCRSDAASNSRWLWFPWLANFRR
jgi:hypothetical protein